MNKRLAKYRNKGKWNKARIEQLKQKEEARERERKEKWNIERDEATPWADSGGGGDGGAASTV